MKIFLTSSTCSDDRDAAQLQWQIGNVSENFQLSGNPWKGTLSKKTSDMYNKTFSTSINFGNNMDVLPLQLQIYVLEVSTGIGTVSESTWSINLWRILFDVVTFQAIDQNVFEGIFNCND